MADSPSGFPLAKEKKIVSDPVSGDYKHLKGKLERWVERRRTDCFNCKHFRQT